MKNFIKLNLIAAGLLFSFNSVEAAKIYEVQNLISGNKYQVTSQDIKGEGLDIRYSFKKDMLNLKITNNTDELININWNDAKYIGLDGKESRAYDFKQKDRGWFESLVSSGIRPGDYYETSLVPSSNLKSVPSAGVTGGVIYIEKNLFDTKSAEVKNRTKEYAEIIIPITIGKPYSGKSEYIVIYLGDKDSVSITSPKKSAIQKPLAPVSNISVEGAIPVQISQETAEKLQQSQEENSKLKAEIRAREQLLKYLQEQEMLKKQLAEKEAEIQKLLKSVNQ